VRVHFLSLFSSMFPDSPFPPFSELRTPLHSVRGVLDLVREISTPDALRPISSLLDVGDSSIQTLHDILEDCLGASCSPLIFASFF
jgi:signal transduction histidine kinase